MNKSFPFAFIYSIFSYVDYNAEEMIVSAYCVIIHNITVCTLPSIDGCQRISGIISNRNQHQFAGCDDVGMCGVCMKNESKKAKVSNS